MQLEATKITRPPAPEEPEQRRLWLRQRDARVPAEISAGHELWYNCEKWQLGAFTLGFAPFRQAEIVSFTCCLI
jgi:hypothetical protein